MQLTLALLALALAGIQTSAAPFKATARLGVPFTLGFQEVVHGTNDKIDTGTLRVVTISSARLAATYPSPSETIFAGAGEKLLVLRGALTNPSTVVLPVSTSSFLGIRFYDGRGKGAFTYAGIYDPQTHGWVHANLRKGQSAAFDCVVRVPAGFDPFRVGLYHENRARIAWYDLRPVLGRMNSVFSPDGLALVDRARASKGQPFDFDTFRMTVLGGAEPAAVGGIARGGQPLYVVQVEVTNAMMLPARWGWQYVTPELVMTDGTTVAGVRDLIDKETDRTWSGDLPPGATMTAQFVFRPGGGQPPAAFRLTSGASKRTIEVPL